MLGAWLPFWPLYLRDLGYSAAAIGTLAAILQGTKIIAPNIWGWLADRSGQRVRVIRFGAFAAIVVFSGDFSPARFHCADSDRRRLQFFLECGARRSLKSSRLAHLREHVHRYSLLRVWGSIGFICAVAGLGFYFDHYSVQQLPLIIFLLLGGIWWCESARRGTRAAAKYSSARSAARCAKLCVSRR